MSVHDVMAQKSVHDVVALNNYWAGDTLSWETPGASYVDMKNGLQSGNTKTYNYFVWPVRGGQ